MQDRDASFLSVMVVRDYWLRMNNNDFWAVGDLLADDFLLEWPQSNERIRGREHFARVNAEYPARGPWSFTIHRVVGGANEAVSDVSVTDGEQHARVISFFTLANGKVSRIVEFWPEPFDAPANRRHLVEPPG